MPLVFSRMAQAAAARSCGVKGAWASINSRSSCSSEVPFIRAPSLMPDGQREVTVLVMATPAYARADFNRVISVSNSAIIGSPSSAGSIFASTGKFCSQ